ALGRPSTYNFDVTSGLVPGERYCFRLREVTSDGTPGEAFDVCGYGLGLTPPPTTVPTTTVVLSIPVTLTPTAIGVQTVPGIDPAPTLAPTPDPFLTLTPASEFAPTPELPDVGQPDSPFPTPAETDDLSAQQQQLFPEASPTIDQFAPTQTTTP